MLNSRIAFRYTGAALATAAAAWWLGGWGRLLLWLSISLAAQAIAYAGWGVAVFRKTNGRLPWAVRILLAPYMICAPQAREAISKGLRAVLDLTAGFPETTALLGLPYCNIQLLPITVPTLEQLRTAVRFIGQHARDGIVYVHGALGYSRSVGVVAAYLLATGAASQVAEAVARVRTVAPQTLLDNIWMERLQQVAGALPQVSTRQL